MNVTCQMSDICLFCKIIKKDIPSEVIYEDALAFSFLDTHPCSPGHALILPKSHAATILEVPEKDLGGLFMAVRRVTEKLERALAPSGFTIGINHGILAGQAVDHLHIHVIPRYTGDGGGSLHSVVHFVGKESVAEMAKKLKA